MHFSIDNAHEVTEGGRTFVAYDFKCNGLFHASVRYSTLLKVYEDYPSLVIPFPPKKFKFKSLTTAEVNERKEMLEKFLARVGEHMPLYMSPIFQMFMVNCQKEIQEPKKDVLIKIFVSDDLIIDLDVTTHDLKNTVLKKLGEKLNLDYQILTRGFMFCVAEKNGNQLTFIRVVADHDLPAVIVTRLENLVLVLRAKLFDVPFIADIVRDPASLNILYHQVIHDFTMKWLKPDDQQKLAIKDARKQDQKSRVVSIAAQIKGFGQLVFDHCYANNPAPSTPVRITMGLQGIVVFNLLDKSETVYPAVRVRCWKLVKQDDGSLSFDIDVLMGGNEMCWVSIRSKQAVFMANLMQCVVEDILRQRVRKKSEASAAAANGDQPAVITRQNSSLASRNNSQSSLSKVDEDSSPSNQSPPKQRKIISITEVDGKRILTAATVTEMPSSTKGSRLSLSDIPEGSSAEASFGGRAGTPGGDSDIKIQVKRVVSSESGTSTTLSSTKKSGLAGAAQSVKDMLVKDKDGDGLENEVFSYGVGDDDL